MYDDALSISYFILLFNRVDQQQLKLENAQNWSDSFHEQNDEQKKIKFYLTLLNQCL